LVPRGIVVGLCFTVLVATPAAELRERLATGTYAGITLDLSLPDQDGLSLVRDLREDPATRRLPIIVVSAYVEEGKTSLNGEAFGIIDWLEKPIDEKKLRKALGRTTGLCEGRKPRVLHVEDDPDICEIVSQSLEGIADVVRAETLMDARERVRTEKFDLLILDIGLPDGSGLELLPMMRGAPHASTPVMVFSAQEVSAKTARHIAASLLKSKTTNETLIATIKSLVSGPAFAARR
jgi:CheY-like chemotaxis protein